MCVCVWKGEMIISFRSGFEGTRQRERERERWARDNFKASKQAMLFRCALKHTHIHTHTPHTHTHTHRNHHIYIHSAYLHICVCLGFIETGVKEIDRARERES